MNATGIRPAGLEPVDCPECRSAGSVYRDFCEVCYADFADRDADAEPLRFTEVMDEIRRAADLAAGGSRSGPDFAAACRRLERLLMALRNQFLEDVVLGLPGTV
ncbi:MAG: hypothetical protein M3Q23_04560 [Actinomycetota bacterium]|nr:hypothetical protein [Actinomycetota bacterium]